MSVVEQAPQQVFEELYDRYARDVYRYALAVLRNPADAEDVAQTTFMNAYRAIKRGERPRKPQHWLIVIAHNACRTRAIRAARRPREVPLDETIRDVPVAESERPNLHAVLEALGQLPFNQRSALVMRELEGRSYEEIAELLGVTVSAVETLIFRARRSLRLRKDALRALAVVQLPASLQGFGGSAAAGAGTFLGGGLVVKAAAVVAAVIAGGATLEAVQSTRHHRANRATAAAPVLYAGSLGSRSSARRAAGHDAARRSDSARAAAAAIAGRSPRGQGPAGAYVLALPLPAAGVNGASAAGAAGSAHPVAPAAAGAKPRSPLPPVPSVAVTATSTTTTVSVPAVPLPPPPPVSAPTVSTPTVPAPPAPVPTVPTLPPVPGVTVTVPQVPPPPTVTVPKPTLP